MEALLAAGLLKVMADLKEWGNAVLDGDLQRLKEAVMEVLAPPQQPATSAEEQETTAAAAGASPPPPSPPSESD